MAPFINIEKNSAILTCLIIWVAFVTNVNAQTTIINPTGDGGFETGGTFAANNWTVVNDGTNAWFVGNASTPSAGARCAYISSSATGTNNNYNRNNSEVSHFYRDINYLPSGTSVLTFKWKGRGETGSDYISVYLTDINFTPTAGILPPAASLIGGPYFNSPGGGNIWQSVSINVPCYSSTKRLVFTWRNDNNGGSSPAGSVDEIRLVSTPPLPGAAGNTCGAAVNIPSLPYNVTGQTTNCMDNDYVVGAGACVGSYLAGEDKVYKLTVLSSQCLIITLNNISTQDIGVSVYNNCPDAGGVCVGSFQQAAPAATSLSGTVTLPGAGTYYIIIDTDGNPAVANYDINITSPSTVGSTCGNPVNVASLPYTANAQSTKCMNNDYTNATPGVCTNAYLGGEDKVYKYTAATSQCISITLSNISTEDIGVSVYSGCPGGGGVCIGNFQQAAFASTTLYGTMNLPAAGTYYIIIDTDGSPTSATFDINITNIGAALSVGLTCGSAVNIPSLPFTANGQSTRCMNNDYNLATVGACLGAYLAGEDRVYKYSASGPECIKITLSNINTQDVGVSVYNGCPDAGGSCVGNFQQATGFSTTLSGNITLPGAGTYYIIVDTDGNPTFANYDFNVISFGAAPSNDKPCNASFLPFNIYFPGNNFCSNNVDEPALPTTPSSCNNWGAANTVWYRFVAPASGCVKIRTALGSLTNTIIAVYTSGVSPVVCGAGASLSLVAGNRCNDDAPACGSNTYRNSELTVSGLTATNNYYIVVDGTAALTGSFSLNIIDGGSGCTNTFNPVTGQDCALPLLICQQSTNIPNPGYQGYGSKCDFGNPSPCTGGVFGCGPCATTCLCSGERSTSWHLVNINANGLLEFNIIPNDWAGGGSTSATDYDFAIYQVSSAGLPGPSSCNNLTSPTRCHFSALGVTGLYGNADGQAPPGLTQFNNAYRSGINVNSGDQFLVLVSNYTNSTSGFTITFSNTSPVAYTVPPGGTIIWTGAISNNWFDPNNWGGCQVPDCNINVLIPGFPAKQPIITGQNASCRSIDINGGASLVLNSGYQLMVCNNFLNNGIFTAQNNSLLLFADTAITAPLTNLHNQTIDGNLTGANKFWHVMVNKPSPYFVKTVQNIDMAGNFTVLSPASTFDAQNKYHKVAGNVDVQVGATYKPPTTLEFNGITQTYFNRGQLNSVFMNQTGAGSVTLLNHGLAGTGWMQLSSVGVLSLANGKIIAGFGPAITNDNKVEVFNASPAAVTTGNTGSYVEGTLGRIMTAAFGSYDFPVGTAAKGYQRINFDFTTALPNSLNYWNIYFNDNPPATNSGLASECGSNYHPAGLFALDNGFWNVETSPTTITSGIAKITNYNQNWTTGLGAGWTVMYNNSFNNSAANWLLNPFPALPCANPPVTAVLRNNISIPALFTGNPVWFGTAQSQTPLPAELLSFNARSLKSSIALSWVTASESNNKGFELERTITPPNNFKKIFWAKGNGSTTQTNYYNFEDNDVKSDINYYYRLKQIDYNGTYKYSKIIAANIGEGDVTFNVLPNPYSGATHISVNLKQSATVNLEVLNVLGQSIKLLMNGYKEAGRYQFEFSAKSLGYSTGIYTVRITINNTVYSKHILETN